MKLYKRNLISNIKLYQKVKLVKIFMNDLTAAAMLQGDFFGVRKAKTCVY